MAADSATNQGRFWEFHDKLFANQNKIGLDDLKKYAKELGLNTAQAKPFSKFANLINAELQRRDLPIPPSANAQAEPGS